MAKLKIRRQIDGKIYDTATAVLISVLVFKGNSSDFDHDYTCLYKTRKGSYFIAGYGGGMSRWRRQARDGNGWVEGEGIKPVTALEARNLLEEYDPEEVEMHFRGEEA